MNGRPHPVRLVALGASDRGDDAVALLAADLVPAAVRDRCEVHRSGCLDVLELVDLPAGRAVVIADAARGIAPGTIDVVPFERLLRPHGPLPAPRSSHELPVDELLRLARVMRGDLPRGCFVVIGGEDFALGAGLSDAVERALPAFVNTLVASIREWDRCVSQPQAG